MRIQAQGIYIAEDSQPYRVSYSLCAKDTCIEQANKSNNWRTRFPTYEHKIAIPLQTQAWLNSQNLRDKLNDLHNVEWEYIP